MRYIYLVIASGGKYDDAWSRNVRAESTAEGASGLCVDLKLWLDAIAGVEEPEAMNRRAITTLT